MILKGDVSVSNSPYAVCFNCYEIYHNMILQYNNSKTIYCCPKVKCEAEVFFIDENMIPIIMVLNKKGYLTRACCSSHIWDPACMYISFYTGIKFNSDLPKEFILSESIWLDEETEGREFNGVFYGIYLSKKVQNKILDMSTLYHQQIIFKYLNILYKWALDLPVNNSKMG